MTIIGSLEKYTILSIGDGLVSQVPAIIISIAAGILVTRSSEEANLGEFVGKQLTVYPRAIGIAGFMLLLFAFFLSETFWPFFTLSLVCFGAAYHYSKVASSNESEFEEIGQGGGMPAPSAPANGSQQGAPSSKSRGRARR